MQNTQAFILGEIVDSIPGLTCRSGIAFRKLAQLSFRHGEFSGATIQTDNDFWKYPHDGLVNVFQSGRTDAHLGAEFPLVD
jgi:hypothetical protein